MQQRQIWLAVILVGGLILTALIVGGVAWYGRRLDTARAREIAPTRLGPDEYRRKIYGAHQHYLESMKQYDRLVPWLSGGALVASIAIVERASLIPSGPVTRVLLGLSWTALLLALASSIWGAYFSTRIHTSSEALLRLEQKENLSDSDRVEYAKRERSKRWAGWWTKFCNVFSGAAVVVGVALLGIYISVEL